MGQYEKDKKELLEKIEQLEHKLKKAKQSGDKDDVDKYSRKLARGWRRRHGHGGDGWFIAVDGVGGPLGPRRAVSDVRVERVPADGVGPPRHRRDVRKLGPV